MRVILVCLFALVASVASAQGVTSHNFRQYMAGAPTPVTASFNFLDSAAVCNQTPPTGPPKIWWDDPVNAGKVCVWTDPGTGPLFAKVYGALEGTLTNLAGTLESPESARSPFLSPPPAPTGVKASR